MAYTSRPRKATGTAYAMRMAVALLLVLAAVDYAAVCARLYLTQTARSFRPLPLIPGAEAVAKASADVVELRLATADDTVLSGLLMTRTRDGSPAPLLLYFGGNQDLCQDFFVNAPRELSHVSLACLDYRGYGASQGKPTEALVKADALLAFDFLSKQTKAPSVILMGRSLGTAVANTWRRTRRRD